LWALLLLVYPIVGSSRGRWVVVGNVTMFYAC
jgi:hypothetical protein